MSITITEAELAKFKKLEEQSKKRKTQITNNYKKYYFVGIPEDQLTEQQKELKKNRITKRKNLQLKSYYKKKQKEKEEREQSRAQVFEE